MPVSGRFTDDSTDIRTDDRSDDRSDISSLAKNKIQKSC